MEEGQQGLKKCVFLKKERKKSESSLVASPPQCSSTTAIDTHLLSDRSSHIGEALPRMNLVVKNKFKKN